MRRASGLIVAVCVALTLPSTAAAARPDATRIVETYTAWDGSEYMFPFGPSLTQTYGQTITAPKGNNTLASFSVAVDLEPSLGFRAYVYEWNAYRGRATGAPLYVSDVLHAPDAGWQRVSVSPDVPVRSGRQYVLVWSVTGLEQEPAASEGHVGYTGDRYSGGGFVYFVVDVEDNTNAQWNTYGWNLDLGPQDLAFDAVFVKARR